VIKQRTSVDTDQMEKVDQFEGPLESTVVDFLKAIFGMHVLASGMFVLEGEPFNASCQGLGKK
jgi:hypothetical protein